MSTTPQIDRMNSTDPMNPLQQMDRTGRQPQQAYGEQRQQSYGEQPQQFDQGRPGQSQPFGQLPYSGQQGHIGQQQGGPGQEEEQGPGTAPPGPSGSQQSGQHGRHMGRTQPFGQQYGLQQVPPQLQQQIQQLAQQPPYEQLLQQLGQAAGTVRNSTATQYWDVVQPLPGRPPILYLLVDDAWRQLLDPSQAVRDAVQRAFAFGHRVLGFYDDRNPGFLQAIVVTR